MRSFILFFLLILNFMACTKINSFVPSKVKIEINNQQLPFENRLLTLSTPKSFLSFDEIARKGFCVDVSLHNNLKTNVNLYFSKSKNNPYSGLNITTEVSINESIVSILSFEANHEINAFNGPKQSFRSYNFDDLQKSIEDSEKYNKVTISSGDYFARRIFIDHKFIEKQLNQMGLSISNCKLKLILDVTVLLTLESKENKKNDIFIGRNTPAYKNIFITLNKKETNE